MISLPGLILTIEFIAFINAGQEPFLTGKTSLVFREDSQGGRKISADVYYPSDSGETDSPLTLQSTERFPVICFNHGYLINPDAYSNIREALIGEGYILIFPKTELGMFPSHKSMAMDTGLVLRKIQELGKDTSSIFFDRVDTIMCVMGHSMGGGISFAAAESFSFIHCLVAMAPFDTRPSAIKAAEKVDIPALIISGDNDCVTPADKYSLPLYEALASRGKTIIHIKGGTHCQMAGKNTLCRIGESLKFCRAEISMEEQHKIINRYLIPWLNFHLKGDSEAGKLFDRGAGSDTAIAFKRSGPLSSNNDR